MNEAALWKWLRPRLPPATFDRVESPTSPGIPDIHYAIDSFQRGWIELKATPHQRGYPFRRENQGMRPSQILWWGRYLANGGRGFLIVAIGPDVAQFEGLQALHLNGLSIDEMRSRALLWVPRRSIKATDRIPLRF